MYKNVRQFIFIFLGCLLLVAGLRPINTFALDDWPIEEPTPTEKPVLNPKVKLVTPSVINVLNGRQYDVELTVKNVGSSYANTVLTQATIEGDAPPFSVKFLDNSNTLINLYDNSTKTMTLQVKVDSNATPGAYTVKLTHSYKNNYNENFSETDTITVKVKNPDVKPAISMENFTNSKTKIEPGDSFTVTADLVNASSADVREVQVSVDGLDITKIYMGNSTNSTYFRQFDLSSKKAASYDLIASPKAKPGSYQLTFKVSYLDIDNEKYEKEFYYYVNVGGNSSDADSKAQIEMEDIKSPNGTFNVGQEFSVQLGIKNTGAAPAKNVKISAILDEDGAIVPKTASKQVVNLLKENEGKALTYKFAASTKSKTQNYVIGFKIEYETGGTTAEDAPEVQSFEQYASVNINNPDAKDKDDPEDEKKVSKPKIIIASYKCNPIIVKAGGEFDLEMVFMNTHSSKSIENIKAVITAVETTEKKGSVFTPLDGSNTFYIDKIAPKQTTEKKFKMFTVPDADPRTYTVSVKFKYQDSEYNEYEEEELIGINVKQITRLETGTMNIPPETTVGVPVYLYFNIMNTGKVAFNNLKVDIEGVNKEAFDTSNSFVFFGKLDKGSSSSYDGSFIVNQPGPQEGKITIEYDDDTGEHKIEETKFTINAMDMPVMEGGEPGMPGGMIQGGMSPDMNGGQPNNLMSYVRNPYVWLGIVIACGAMFFGYKKFRKKKVVSFDE